MPHKLGTPVFIASLGTQEPGQQLFLGRNSSSPSALFFFFVGGIFLVSRKSASPGHLSFKRGGRKPHPLRRAKGSGRGAHLLLPEPDLTNCRPGTGKLKAWDAARVRGPAVGGRGLRSVPAEEAALRSAASLEGWGPALVIVSTEPCIPWNLEAGIL